VNGRCHNWFKEGMMDDTNMASPGIESRVLGRIGFPPSSFRAEIFAAHRTVAMLRKSELFAINRPTQILESCLNRLYRCKCTGIIHTSFRSPEKQKRYHGQHNRSVGFVGALRMIHVLCVDDNRRVSTHSDSDIVWNRYLLKEAGSRGINVRWLSCQTTPVPSFVSAMGGVTCPPGPMKRPGLKSSASAP